MRHPEFPVVSLLAVPLLLSSLPSHIRTGSVCVIALIAWLTVLNIIRAVNSLVWADNFIIRLEVWCDITTKILIGFTYAVPLSALCICRQLEHVSSSRQVMITSADKRRRMKFEAIMCFGVPMIFMALHYIVQGHRFDLIEDFGCYPATYVSVAGLLIVWIPPLVISLTTMVYAVAAFHHFLQRRIEFASILRSSNSAISPARYFRLMAFAVFEILWDSSTNIYIIYFNVNLTGLRPWISWENVHSNFSRVGTFPHLFTPNWVINQFIWQWWIIPISCLFFFLFFGLGEEAVTDYRSAIDRFCRALRRPSRKPSTSTILPTHNRTSPHHVALPSHMEQEAKAWDELSLKMPDTVEYSLHPNAFVAGAHVSESDLTPKKMSRECSRSIPPDGAERSTVEVESVTLEQSMLPSPGPAYNTSLPPAVTITAPETEASHALDNVTKLLVTAELPLHPRRTFPSPVPASHRRSTSTDLGITVSQAFLPEADTLSSYREEAVLKPAAFSSAQPSHVDVTHTYANGGIRMTVEKNVT